MGDVKKMSSCLAPPVTFGPLGSSFHTDASTASSYVGAAVSIAGAVSSRAESMPSSIGAPLSPGAAFPSLPLLPQPRTSRRRRSLATRTSFMVREGSLARHTRRLKLVKGAVGTSGASLRGRRGRGECDIWRAFFRAVVVCATRFVAVGCAAS